MKFIINILRCSILAFSVILHSSCNRPKAVLPALENSYKQIPDQAVSRNPDDKAYGYENNNAGYELAGSELKNPLQPSKDNLEKGKNLYQGLCAHCHGEKGHADAPMIVKEKYPPPPPFNKRLPTISEGKMFHSITYGKNQMPPNEDDLNTGQKWLLVMYIQTLVDKSEETK